jgi:hypothetical protein
VALLTNGVIYQFFTDSERTNMMDEKPFFTFNLENFRKADIKHLSTFQRADFDLDRIVNQAGALKLQTQVLAELRNEFSQPSEEFVRLIASRLHDGPLTEAVRERFQGAMVQAIANLIREGINERLESAMSHGEDPADFDGGFPEPDAIETTQVEIDGFNIVRAICSKLVKPERVIMRDAKSYCAILLDDNNRKTLARLHFNSPTARYLGLFTGKNEEQRRPVSGPVDIYQHSDAILARVQELESAKT